LHSLGLSVCLSVLHGGTKDSGLHVVVCLCVGWPGISDTEGSVVIVTAAQGTGHGVKMTRGEERGRVSISETGRQTDGETDG